MEGERKVELKEKDLRQNKSGRDKSKSLKRKGRKGRGQ